MEFTITLQFYMHIVLNLESDACPDACRFSFILVSMIFPCIGIKIYSQFIVGQISFFPSCR